MKILDISSFYSPLGGGVRTYHHRKLDFFAEHAEHEYVLLAAGARNEVEMRPGGKIYYVKGFPVARAAVYRQMWDFLEVRRILRAEQPDIIEVGSPYLDCWLALLNQSGLKARIVGLYHADFPDSYIAPAVKNFPRPLARYTVDFWKGYVRRTYQRFAITFVSSRYIEQKLRGYGLNNTHLAPLGVDTELFNPARRSLKVRRELGVGDGEKLLLYAGRFSFEKGIEPLLEALRVLAKRPKTKIALAGHGPLEDQAIEVARDFDTVKWLGFIDDPARLGALYASADLFLAPGPVETFGLSTLEALSSGLPVAAAASGGNGELVTASRAGAVFCPESGVDLARSVEELLQADRDALGERARSFAVSHFSWERTFLAMIAKYEEIR